MPDIQAQLLWSPSQLAIWWMARRQDWLQFLWRRWKEKERENVRVFVCVRVCVKPQNLELWRIQKHFCHSNVDWAKGPLSLLPAHSLTLNFGWCMVQIACMLYKSTLFAFLKGFLMLQLHSLLEFLIYLDLTYLSPGTRLCIYAPIYTHNDTV